MKKIALYSLIGPIIVLFLRVFDIINQVIMLGFNGIYDCASYNSFEGTKCSFFDYVFLGDVAMSMYLGIFASYILLFLAINYIVFLIRLYKDNKHTELYFFIALTLVVIVAFYFLTYYI